ncbi:MAG: hypothetical protein L0216_17125 [Planctomycetales bacterium]|nr:hypothetical protein [Planctomycetales bacterium]
MALSADPTFEKLRTGLVCGWRDITGEPWSGRSGRYDPDQGAAWTTNGAGPHNMQLFVLYPDGPDGVVLHCLPGYWETHDLAEELAFAEGLGRLWASDLPRAEKDRRFREAHLAHIGAHSQETVDRSQLQNFDKGYERRRRPDTSDCILREDSLQPRRRPRARKPDEFKTTDQIVHERMAARPFVRTQDFDVEAFTDYGRPKYDKKKPVLLEEIGETVRERRRS